MLTSTGRTACPGEKRFMGENSRALALLKTEAAATGADILRRGDSLLLTTIFPGTIAHPTPRLIGKGRDQNRLQTRGRPGLVT